MNRNALIGFSGFVGTTIRKQKNFSFLYRKSNIQEIAGQEFDLVCCSGVPAQKWIANRNPKDDINNINILIKYLKKIKCNHFILISTVDVFKIPLAVNEASVVDKNGLHPYGYHRRLLEEFVQKNFENHLIIRLPGLVGPGLRKNIIFDFLNKNNLSLIDSRNSYQFYPMVNLWTDIQISLKERLQLVHLTAAPISVSDVSLLGFGKKFEQKLENKPVSYDMQTLYSEIFESTSKYYQYSMRETILAVRAYAQSELLKEPLE